MLIAETQEQVVTGVDVVVETVIDRSRAEVAAFAGEPTNAPRWYVNIKQAQYRSGSVPEVGARVAFVAHFLGRKLEYTYEIVEHIPGERLVMRTAEGPFPMETTYTWHDVDVDGGSARTRMTLRNRGNPQGFAKVFAPLMASAMKRATTKDLARLKEVLER